MHLIVFFNKKHSLKIQNTRRQTKKTPQMLITTLVASKDVLYHTLPKVWQIPPVAPGIAPLLAAPFIQGMRPTYKGLSGMFQ